MSIFMVTTSVDRKAVPFHRPLLLIKLLRYLSLHKWSTYPEGGPRQKCGGEAAQVDPATTTWEGDWRPGGLGSFLCVGVGVGRVSAGARGNLSRQSFQSLRADPERGGGHVWADLPGREGHLFRFLFRNACTTPATTPAAVMIARPIRA